MPTTQIIECADRVWEVTFTPGVEVVGRCRRHLTVCQLSGPELSGEEAERVQRLILSALFDQGCRVYHCRRSFED